MCMFARWIWNIQTEENGNFFCACFPPIFSKIWNNWNNWRFGTLSMHSSIKIPNRWNIWNIQYGGYARGKVRLIQGKWIHFMLKNYYQREAHLSMSGEFMWEELIYSWLILFCGKIESLRSSLKAFADVAYYYSKLVFINATSIESSYNSRETWRPHLWVVLLNLVGEN